MNYLVLPLAFAGLLTLAACSGDGKAASTPAEAVPVAAIADPALPPVTVYKAATCGCCSDWISHLRQHGFTVGAVDVQDLSAVKAQYGIPPGLQSCHMAVVDGYVIEGHVPAVDVKRLLDERPDAAGLAAPGMPVGSPGISIPGRAADAYEVLLVDDGRTSVFARH